MHTYTHAVDWALYLAAGAALAVTIVLVAGPAAVLPAGDLAAPLLIAVAH